MSQTPAIHFRRRPRSDLLAGSGALASDAAASDGGVDAGPTLCDIYCETVMETCDQGARVYPTLDLCLAACPYLPEGEPGDVIGNTVQCRLGNARLARVTGERDVHCPIAGPGGNGVCGDDCSAYCTLMAGACDVRFDEVFLGLPDCLSTCEELPNLGTYDVALPMRSGNTVQCRLYHVSSATVDPNRHCGHAAGEPPCVDP